VDDLEIDGVVLRTVDKSVQVGVLGEIGVGKVELDLLANGNRVA
jgi:hypothetical protein